MTANTPKIAAPPRILDAEAGVTPVEEVGAISV
jgi:hypothetical protein